MTDLQTPTKKALVVEGGAMRGIFAAGVLDAFIDHLYRPFDFCIGVSIGSTNLAGWLANQRARSYKVITDYSSRPEFMSFSRFLTGGHWFDLDWLWEITIREYRFDLDTFTSQPVPLYVAVTRVATGEALYIPGNADNLAQLLKASCSIPIIYRDFPQLDGEPMADGGVADAIPVIKAYEMGAREITVILSHPRWYRVTPPVAPWLVRRTLSKTPQLAEAVIQRAASYNRAMDFIDKPPQDCRVHVLAPPGDFAVNRVTRDRARLDAGYQMGLDAAREFLNKDESN